MEYVYKIINTQTGKFYVGRTANIDDRIKRHFNSLANGRHHSIYLQRSYNKYGKSNFNVEYKEVDNSKLEEQYILDSFYDSGVLYNVSKCSDGGDNITYHPNKDEIIKRMIEAQNKKLEKMSVEERKRKFGNSLEKNGRWKGGVSFSYCDVCGCRITANSKHCKNHTIYNMAGDKNPFYGKHHTVETKKKISDKLKGKPNYRDRKKVSIDGVEYESCTKAAEILGLSAGTITYRCKSSNFPECNYIKSQTTIETD